MSDKQMDLGDILCSFLQVMIKTQKKMHELQAELKDLGVDEEKARFDSCCSEFTPITL